LLKRWFKIGEYGRARWCLHHGLVASRVQAFVSSAKFLLDRLSEAVSLNESKFRHLHGRQQQLSQSHGSKASTHSSSGTGRGHNGKTVPTEAGPKKLSFAEVTMPLSPEKQNLLRLILAWCSERNILRSTPKKATKQLDLFTAYIESPKLSNASVKSIFGNTCKWQLERIIGQESLHGNVSMETGEELTSFIIAITEYTRAQFVFVRLEPTLSRYYAIQISGVGDVISEHGEDVRNLISLSTKCATVRIDYSTPLYSDVRTFHVYNCTYTAENWVDDWLPALKRAVGGVVVVDHYSRDSKRHVCVIRPFGVQISDMAAKELFRGGEERKYTGSFAGREIADSQQVIQFPDPLTEDHTGCVIADAPMGMRVLNACKLLYKDNTMKLRTIESYGKPESGSSKASVPAVAVGSEAWRKSKEAAKKSGQDDSDAAGIETCQLVMKTLTNSWGFAARSGKVNLSKNSYLSQSSHCGSDIMFCTAYNIVENQTYGSTLSYAEGVTLLPVGGRWLALAMLCTRGHSEEAADVAAIAEKYCGGLGDILLGKPKADRNLNADRNDLLKFDASINTAITDEDREFCDEFRHHLDSVIDEPLEFNPELIALLSKIFQDWYVIGANLARNSKIDQEDEEYAKAGSSIGSVSSSASASGAGAGVGKSGVVGPKPGEVKILNKDANSKAKSAAAGSKHSASSSATTHASYASATGAPAPAAPPTVKLVPLATKDKKAKPVQKSGSKNTFETFNADDGSSSNDDDDDDEHDDESDEAVGHASQPSASDGATGYDDEIFEDRFGSLNLTAFVKDSVPTLPKQQAAMNASNVSVPAKSAAVSTFKLSDSSLNKQRVNTPKVADESTTGSKQTQKQTEAPPSKPVVKSSTNQPVAVPSAPVNATATFVVGDRIRTANLQNADFNDKEGVIIVALNPASGRCGVKMFLSRDKNNCSTGLEDKDILLKPQNLVKVGSANTFEDAIKKAAVEPKAIVKTFKLDGSANAAKAGVGHQQKQGPKTRQEESHKCEYCEELVIGSEETLENHILAAHTMFCSTCDEPIMDCMQFSLHYKIKHKMKFSNYSLYRAATEGLLISMDQYIPTPAYFQTPNDGSKSAASSSASTSAASGAGGGGNGKMKQKPSKFDCRGCKSSFKTKAELQQHERTYHEFFCFHCYEPFYNNDPFYRHLTNAHGFSDELVYHGIVNAMDSRFEVVCRMCRKKDNSAHFRTDGSFFHSPQEFRRHVYHKHGIQVDDLNEIKSYCVNVWQAADSRDDDIYGVRDDLYNDYIECMEHANSGGEGKKTSF
jgi:hypothetical protein